MKAVVVINKNQRTNLPKTSSHKLNLDILYSLIGYEFLKVNTVVYHDKDFILPESNAFSQVIYENIHDDLTEVLVQEKPDVVIGFDINLAVVLKDLPISNLILCISEAPIELSDELKNALTEKWIKVISFLPALSKISGIKINKVCTAVQQFGDEFPDDEKTDDIIIPIDGSIAEFYRELPLNSVIREVRKYYPRSRIKLAFLGANVGIDKEDSEISVVSCHSLGEYLQELSKCSLQVCINIPYSLNMYPFYGLLFGIPPIIYSNHDFTLTDYYPYLQADLTEILDKNDTEVQANREVADDLPNYLKALAGGYDEIRFNIEFHTALRSLSDIDFRDEYRESIEDRMKKLDQYYKDHPELNVIKPKEDKDKKDEGNNGLQESKESD